MNRRSRSVRHPRHGGLLGGVLVCLVLVGILGAAGYRYIYQARAGAAADRLITQVASRGAFDHIVLEEGEIESSSNVEIVSEVKSRGGSMGGTSILWVIDEGSKAKKGDKLVELDSSELELSLKEQKIQVITAEARKASAEALLEQAKISREEYLEGVFKTEEKDILSQKAIAEQNLRKAQLAIESSKRLVAKGLIKSLQLDADGFAVANAQNQLESADGKLRVLRDLTKAKMLVKFDSDIESAEAQLSAARSELMEEQLEMQEIEDQIKKCVIFAPADGVVVHANQYSSRGGSAEFVVEAGATVRERQAIIRLPDPSQMQVNVKINESRVTLIDEGMPAKIAVDAIPGLKLTGRVTKVNRYAEPSSFFGTSIKEYATIISIIDPPDSIRTGMTAEVQIFVEQLDNALQIPIQGLYEHGNEMYSLLQRGPQQFETVKVKIGATNDTMASIDEGLSEADLVVLNLRDHLSLMNLPEVEREDNSNMRDLAQLDTLAASPADGPAGGPGERADRGPGERGPGERGPGGRGPGGRVPDDGPSGGEGAWPPRGGRPEGAAGGFGGAAGGFGGGPGGGGPPNVNVIVTRTMERIDTDGDGTISAAEISAMDPERSAAITAADADGDGNVSRAELLRGMRSRMGEGGGR